MPRLSHAGVLGVKAHPFQMGKGGMGGQPQPCRKGVKVGTVIGCDVVASALGQEGPKFPILEEDAGQSPLRKALLPDKLQFQKLTPIQYMYRLLL